MRIVDRAIVSTLPVVPRPVVRRVASRYVAGETLDQAVDQVRALNAAGELATIDVLGEFAHSAEEAAATVGEYERAMDVMAEANVEANISVKLSALGLEFDRDLAYQNIARLIRAAAFHRSRVRIDMEHSGLTDSTLAIYRDLRAEGLDQCGIVIQSYLRRSLGDIRALAALKPNVRLVKGIYVEPKAIAYTDPGTIQRNFVELLEELLGVGSYVAVATHDQVLVDETLRVIDRHGLKAGAYEFQMLLGVAEPLRKELVRDGHRVRVYVPYGEAWYAYAVRRLRENPSIAGHVARDVLRTPWNLF